MIRFVKVRLANIFLVLIQNDTHTIATLHGKLACSSVVQQWRRFTHFFTLRYLTFLPIFVGLHMTVFFLSFDLLY